MAPWPWRCFRTPTRKHRCEDRRRPSLGVLSTGFPALDAILGPSGLPAEASVVVRGGPSSGKTTLALRCVAEAQASGDIVAWLDLGAQLRSGGGGRPWRGPALAAGRPSGGRRGGPRPGRCAAVRPLRGPARRGPAGSPARRARTSRSAASWPTLAGSVRASSCWSRSRWRAVPGGAVAAASGMRLELERRAWLRLGRDVVGQRTRVAVAKNRYGPPGRSVDLDIHYLIGGERCPGDAPAGLGERRPGAVPGAPALERTTPRLVVV